ncbi:transcriptional regulator, LacI family [Cohaesibacter sp. ES.047]|uniref:LacI family transcriptional regulator n=1 Tax=Cohaesibacter sp. ES.047 TaxID=1798205 RepID=UPI000BB75575|nr:LacI family transcriptional regulator [Cohaesibacter sp. ES.047]SNY94131.1 transcriptional regulator, LacI family [Cohaesibacter sp. ES.047]
MAKDSKRPTQRTIADVTGFAVTTVSRALKGDLKIAEATRLKVAQVAKEIGYVPDRAALRLRTGKTRTISLILNPHDEIFGFGNSLIAGLSEALAGSDYHLNITPAFGGGDEITPIRRLVENSLVDGLVLTRTQNFDERIRYLLEKNFPFVSHGRTDFSTPHHFVDFDNEAFAYQAVQRLADKGRSKLAIILPQAHYTFHQHMRYGFMRAIRESGLQAIIPEEVTLDSTQEQVDSWLRHLLEDETTRDVDGFICPGEASYLALYSALRAVGRTRGEDYDVVVKCNHRILEQIDPGIDRVHEEIGEAGRQMGEILIDQLRDGADEVQQIVRDPQIRFD